MTELASRVRFQTQEIHEWLGDALRFTPAEVARGDGLDVAALEVPPGGKTLLRIIKDWRRLALLNKIGAYKLLARIEAAEIRKAPAMLLITGADDAPGALAAGRLLERAWLMLAGAGVAAHPYYVVPDQLQRARLGSVPPSLTETVSQVSAAAAGLLDSPERTLHMVLRLGYPKCTVVRSRRLPLEAVTTVQA